MFVATSLHINLTFTPQHPRVRNISEPFALPVAHVILAHGNKRTHVYMCRCVRVYVNVRQGREGLRGDLPPRPYSPAASRVLHSGRRPQQSSLSVSLPNFLTESVHI